MPQSIGQSPKGQTAQLRWEWEIRFLETQFKFNSLRHLRKITQTLRSRRKDLHVQIPSLSIRFLNCSCCLSLPLSSWRCTLSRASPSRLMVSSLQVSRTTSSIETRDRQLPRPPRSRITLAPRPPFSSTSSNSRPSQATSRGSCLINNTETAT